jgi:hypothetical protein
MTRVVPGDAGVSAAADCAPRTVSEAGCEIRLGKGGPCRKN